MDRRRFLHASLLGSAALAFARTGFGAALSSSAERFADGIVGQPWLAGWRDAPLFDGSTQILNIVGKIPSGLTGTLYRNGPGRFTRDNFRYQHWFDGDGLIHAWRIGSEGISHQARFVGTRKFEREEAAGRFLLPAAGTRVPNALPIRNSDDLNVANTAVFTHAGELYALWEGGSAYQLDDETLQAKGPKIWREDTESLPFSAHPLHEQDGSLWNFGLMNRTMVIWRIGADGVMQNLKTIETPFPGYLHAFSMTEQHLIFILLPYVNEGNIGNGEAYFEGLHWQPSRGCRALVVDKNDLSRQRWFSLPAGAAYHYGPAVQQGRELVIQACWNRDGKTAISPFRSEMQGVSKKIDTGSSLERISLNLDNGRARMETMLTGAIDFPSWNDANRNGQMFALTGGERSESGYFNSVSAIDPDNGMTDTYDYGEGCMVEEHRFVPAPDARRTKQGWLIGNVLDYRRGRSGISILDAENLAGGPMAQAWLPHTIPLGFHGWFHR